MKDLTRVFLSEEGRAVKLVCGSKLISKVLLDIFELEGEWWVVQLKSYRRIY